MTATAGIDPSTLVTPMTPVTPMTDDEESSGLAWDRAAMIQTMMAETLPTTSAAVIAHRRLACPEHGLLPARNIGACPSCEKKPYDVDGLDDRSILTSLRGVARSGRMIRARVIGYPAALGLLVLILGAGSLSFLLIPVLGEPLARGIERLLRQLQPAAARDLDNELL